ncbi:BLOC-1-related complex subunit 7 [Pogonomyrmex barbatus]|uniref:BLOC-1-related complex subunit 7 n=1 Tax=Pogonomyrmex barbatus TaxID=144034 RepID=A0A6I9WL94_9HYME|nr:BLOC-1-related complex subunit 7 [Pogonomyrmex barbatus]
MASASSTSARSLFIESKLRLADRVQVNVNNIASLARQIQRGSKSNEMLTHAARNFAQQEHGLETMKSDLKKLELIVIHLKYQIDTIDKSLVMLEEVTEQVRSMQR